MPSPSPEAWGDYTRTWICGKDAAPQKELVDLHMRAYERLRRAEMAIKPGVGGIRLEDDFVVTEDGCECISAGTPFEPKLMG